MSRNTSVNRSLNLDATTETTSSTSNDTVLASPMTKMLLRRENTSSSSTTTTNVDVSTTTTATATTTTAEPNHPILSTPPKILSSITSTTTPTSATVQQPSITVLKSNKSSQQVLESSRQRTSSQSFELMSRNHELNFDVALQRLQQQVGGGVGSGGSTRSSSSSTGTSKAHEASSSISINDFHVISFLGGRATGKSFLANLIANASHQSTRNDDRTVNQNEQPFDLCGLHELVHCERKTRGIQMYVSHSDRIILLDCEALFTDGFGSSSSSSSSSGSMGGLGVPSSSSSSTTDMEPETMSVQLGLFLYSVSHVIVVPYTESGGPDRHLLRFMRTLENLRKGIPDLFQSVVPRILFTANNVMVDDNGGRNRDRSAHYSLSSSSSLSPSSSSIMSCSMLRELNGYDICLVPHNPTVRDSDRFRDQVLCRIHRKFRGTEIDWLNSCGDNWKHIRKHAFLLEYTRTVQRLYLSS